MPPRGLVVLVGIWTGAEEVRWGGVGVFWVPGVAWVHPPLVVQGGGGRRSPRGGTASVAGGEGGLPLTGDPEEECREGLVPW